MGHLKSGLRPAFALFVIAHGLAHAVLPMRGWMNPETLGRDFVPVILYGVAVLGYVIAGIGVLGVQAVFGSGQAADVDGVDLFTRRPLANGRRRSLVGCGR